MTTHASPIALIAERERFQREILHRADRIPSLPDLVVKLLKLIDSDKTNAGEFERHLSCEPTLIAKMLRVVNSPLYGFSRKVVSVQDCVVVLGMRGLKSLILAANTADYMDRNFECYGYHKSGLWKHAIAVATASRSLGKVAGLPVDAAEALFLGGLLHDIGKVVMAPYLSERGINLNQHGCCKAPGLQSAERELLGFGHVEAGVLVTTRWNLGPAVTDIVAHHHQPSEARSSQRECAVVHLADHLACEKRIGLIETADVELAFEPAALDIAQLTKEQFRDAREKIVDEMSAMNSVFS